jgi:hypothetical protein
MAVYSWPSDAAILYFRPNDGSTPESVIEAVSNPDDLRPSPGQAMVQFAAKRWFKSQDRTGFRGAKRDRTRRGESRLGEPTKQNEDERRARSGREAVKRSGARP